MAIDCPVYVPGDYNGNHRLLGDWQNIDPGEKLIEFIEIDGWNHLGLDFKTFHNQQRRGTPYKVMGCQSNILNWRIQRGSEIWTYHIPIKSQIKIKTAARDNYNLAD